MITFNEINIELTNRCNKNCVPCGRRKLEKLFPERKYEEDMDFELLKKIHAELPDGMVIQFHNNGEPLLYPQLSKAIDLFTTEHIVCLNTNGKLLRERSKDIIGNLHTMAVSVVEDDEESNEQYLILRQFLKLKGDKSPYVIIRILGKVDMERYVEIAKQYNCLIATRTLHSPMGSFNYEKSVTIPENGICRDFLSKPCISVNGDFSICVRFDPYKEGVIGNVQTQSINEIWHSEIRIKWLRNHIKGQRDKINLCSKCHFYGCPTP